MRLRLCDTDGAPSLLDCSDDCSSFRGPELSHSWAAPPPPVGGGGPTVGYRYVVVFVDLTPPLGHLHRQRGQLPAADGALEPCEILSRDKETFFMYRYR